ncbi:5-histidylcysteine sulfoxide synthase [Thalassomonas actiniarum]|uniref:5-histidylcysteine sulfoxide synthase n=1 Tax=Thalassomonas actiniarum TaxID=485447 RepID=A0AAE9YQ06_9GAMM|nr:5-histidylcysteine sulfoxide synthase [Thalassomonas actiniarum]WDD98562.1 5-histidylcysteine sulfoxide synthase [Thalassomonas actiniarum]
MNITKQQMTPPLLTGTCAKQKRAELKAYFQNSWDSYDSLFSLIKDPEAFYLRPEKLRHPLIFYFGHTATFYINKFILGKYLDKRINEKLEAICAVGVDEMSWDDLDSSHYDWPAVNEVTAYRKQVKALVEQLIDTMELSLPITKDSLAWVILMGCEHERIHIETSSVIMRMLPLQYLTPSEQWQACPYSGDAPQNTLVAVTGKTVHLGKADSDHTYGWDNEYGQAELEVRDFQASRYLVSNQEFLGFVEAGGYDNPAYWNEEGQQWLAFTRASMPRFWLKKGESYFQRNLLSEMPLPLDWPVEVNYLEAHAFCRWKSGQSSGYIRLPTEAEWYCLRDKIPTDLVDWQEAPGNINLQYFASSCPVNRFETDGLFDITGNVWQWTESAIDGFNGFEVHPLYDDFSTPTFDGKHNLIKGGSWISTGNEACKSSRYAFRRHFFQHAGFRYIHSEFEEIPAIAVNHYETSREICRQLENHYGEPGLNLGNYAQQLAQKLIALTDKYAISRGKMLDLGCSVGRCAFELAPDFGHIDAVDFSARYIQHGVRLQQGNSVRYTCENEGDIVDFKEINLTGLGLEQGRDKINFCQGDAANLKAIFSDYDVILAQQVLELSYDPRLFLATIRQRLKAGGLLVLVSDYGFSEQITEKSKWLGGIKVNGENVTGFDGLRQYLAGHFNLLEQQEITRVLKANRRNYQVSEQQLTVWQLKND